MSKKEINGFTRPKLESAFSGEDYGALGTTRKAVISFTPDILQSTLLTRLEEEDDLLMQV